MLKTVIVTFINSYNYGAFLQAKATEEVFSQIGLKVCFLNYCNKEEENQRKLIAFSSRYSFAYNLKRIAFKLWYGYLHGDIINGKKNFQKMIDELPKTEKYNCIEDIEKADRIDILVCGSDQIWNPEICNNTIDPVYFGGFNNVGVRISFASSFGSYLPSGHERDIMAKFFRKFNAISVREKFGRDIIKSMGLETDIEIVLDPTLCLSAQTWENLVKAHGKHFEIEEDYAVLYFVNSKINCQSLINYIKKKLKLKTIWIKNNNLKRLAVDKIVTNATPYDFVNLIRNAKFVLTDSFHGTAFSIIFNVDFISILNKKNPERVLYLCKELGIVDRIAGENDQICKLEKIDFSIANEKLKHLRKHSLEWLKRAVK